MRALAQYLPSRAEPFRPWWRYEHLDHLARRRALHRGDPGPRPAPPAGPGRRRGWPRLDPGLAGPARPVRTVRRRVLRAGQAGPFGRRGDGVRERGPWTDGGTVGLIDVPGRGGGRRPDR